MNPIRDLFAAAYYPSTSLRTTGYAQQPSREDLLLHRAMCGKMIAMETDFIPPASDTIVNSLNTALNIALSCREAADAAAAALGVDLPSTGVSTVNPKQQDVAMLSSWLREELGLLHAVLSALRVKIGTP